MTDPQNCTGCGAPFELTGDGQALLCHYCGTRVAIEPQVIDAVEVVESAESIEAKKQQNEFEEREKIRAQIEEQQAICDRVQTLTIPVFLGLAAPGFFGGFFETVLLATSGQVVPAILTGIGGGALFITGITIFMYLNTKKERAEKKIKELEERLGKDTRSFGEKVLDKGLGWMFGKKRG